MSHSWDMLSSQIKYQIEEIFVTQAFSSERNEIFQGLGTAILSNNL